MTEPVNPFTLTTSQPTQFYEWQPAPQGMNPQTAWQPQPGSHYFENDAYIHHFEAKRNLKKAHNAAHRPGPPWTEQDEILLVNDLHMAWIGEPFFGEGMEDWTNKFEHLNLDKIEPSVIPRRKLPPFKIEYETYNEARLRLMNTVILINGSPFYVTKLKQKDGDFVLGVIKSNNDQPKVVKFKDLQDLRTMPSMYVTTNSTGWLCRNPARVYQQGINRNNTQIRTVDGRSVLYNLDAMSLIKAIDRRTDKEWHHSYEGLMESNELTSVRLSDDIAVTSTDCVCCYRGRPLGKISQGEVICNDEDDLQQQWIEKSAKKVGLELRV